MNLRQQLRGIAPQLSAAVPMWMLTLVALGIILSVTENLGLSAAQTASWIMTFFGVMAVLGILFSVRYRQPWVFTGHVLAVILFGSLGGEVSFPEMVGAAMVAGGLVLVLGATGVTGVVTSWIPAPVVMGVIAGAVVPFVADMFTSLGTTPLVVGSMLLAYVASQLLLGTRILPILPAVAAGVIAAGLTGRLGGGLPGAAMPDPILIVPEFSVEAIVAAVPVLIVLTLSGNIPSVVYLRDQGYDPPERSLNIACGGATIFASLFGPLAVTAPAPVLPIVGGPNAGPPEHRYRAGVATAVLPLVIALGASTAAPLARFVPRELIFSIAGLAVIPILRAALDDAVSGPLRLGPVVAFAVVLSDISLLGLGPFFWALVLGTAFSLLLEREGWAQLQAERA